MKGATMLLTLFIVLTIVFASISVFEYLIPLYSTTAQTLYTTTTITTTVTTRPQSPLSNQGLIQIVDGGSFKPFTYTQWNASTPNSFTILNVKFTLWTNTTVTNTGGSCYGAVRGYGGYAITFPDGSTETKTTCTIGTNPPTAIRLTKHLNPQAGLFIIPSTGAVYFLVSA